MNNEAIAGTILRCYPDAEAIYLFGSYGTDDEQGDSDVDIAVLLPAKEAKSAVGLPFGECLFALEGLLKKEVDLINLRMVNTVFQHEIIQGGRIIYQRNEQTVDWFEMLVISFYQKLNEERAGILEEIFQSGRVLRV